MYPIDNDEFAKVLTEQATLFGLPKGVETITQLMDSYWSALKDVTIEAVKREATRHARYGKFFPKPYELRPKDDKPKHEEGEAASGARASFERQNQAVWNKLLHGDRLPTLWKILDAYNARTLSSAFESGTTDHNNRVMFAAGALDRIELQAGGTPRCYEVLRSQIREQAARVRAAGVAQVMELEL
jgi:hypothetical protein